MLTADIERITKSTVLALEPNPGHAIALRRACDLAQASLTLVDSKDEFLDALEDSRPDLVLLPSLLSLADESELFAHLRTLTDSGHMQVLLTPHSLTPDAPPPMMPARGWRRLFHGPALPKAQSCDPHSFAERVTWALESAQEARQALAERNRWLYGTPGLSAEDRRVHTRYAATQLLCLQVARIKNGPQVRVVDLSEGGVLLETDTHMHRGSSGLLELVGESRETLCSFRVLRWHPSPLDPAAPYRLACVFTEPFNLDRVLPPQGAAAASEDVTADGPLAPFIRCPEDQCERDRRRTRDEVPWLSTVKLPWGVEVDLLNISSTGLLIETNSRFTPGTAIEFQLSGPDTTLEVSAHFVRSEVAAVGPRGVKYHAAARFIREITLREQAQSRSAASSPVAELLEVLGDVDRGADRTALRTRFSQRLRSLVPAREIEIANIPAGPLEGTESIYFSVPASGRASAVLQATFEPDYEISEVEFRLLRTAATLASVVLDLERDPS